MVFGSGIVCGMSVKSLDDVSILVESGVALDSFGREIVIPESCVKKLSAIDGFEEIKSDECRLCVSYDQKDVQPVYSANKKDKNDEYEYNRISENFKLYLLDTTEAPEFEENKSDFLLQEILFKNDDYKITVTAPSIVCIGCYVKLSIQLLKLSDSEGEISYSGLLQFPSFTTDDVKHEKRIVFDRVSLVKGEEQVIDIWVKVDNMETKETNVMIKASSVECTAGVVEKDMILNITGEKTEPRNLVDSEIGKVNFEARTGGQNSEMVWLADIKINRMSNSYEIESVDEKSVKSYIETPADDKLRNLYLDYFRMEAAPEKTGSSNESLVSGQNYENEDESELNMTTGIIEIPIGRAVKKGEVFYSDEVVHGLGRGNVCIMLGCQIKEVSSISKNSADITVFGDAGIFENDTVTADFDLAVKVFNEKGSFVVGARAKNNTECLIIKYRWYAMNYLRSFAQNDIPIAQDRRIIVETPTVVLKPGENYFFSVRFNNMENAQLGYELTDGSKGSISLDGVYTAPEQDGVYEIRIYCLNDPSICSYAYAIVKRNE
jgi:hypothetical protein